MVYKPFVKGEQILLPPCVPDPEKAYVKNIDIWSQHNQISIDNAHTSDIYHKGSVVYFSYVEISKSWWLVISNIPPEDQMYHFIVFLLTLS